MLFADLQSVDWKFDMELWLKGHPEDETPETSVLNVFSVSDVLKFLKMISSMLFEDSNCTGWSKSDRLV